MTPRPPETKLHREQHSETRGQGFVCDTTPKASPTKAPPDQTVQKAHANQDIDGRDQRRSNINGDQRQQNRYGGGPPAMRLTMNTAMSAPSAAP